VERQHLLDGAAKFVDRVKRIHGVVRIALIGSLTTAKTQPNDVDLLVTVETNDVVPAVAAAARKLAGHALTMNRGADVFLAGSSGAYLGRTCPWRECGPGIRTRCRAQHCGGHLYDDLHIVTLPTELIASPPLVIWPKAVVHGDVPADTLQAFGIVR
jgi:predicted nucleotidyltransferase